MKKILSLFLAMVMMVTLLSGCTSDEAGMWNLMKEISSSSITESTAIIDVDAEKFFEFQNDQEAINGSNLTEDEKALMNKVRDFLKTNSIKMVAKGDKDKAELSLEAYVVDKTTKSEQIFTTLIIKDEKVYVNIKQAIAYLDKAGYYKTDELINNTGKDIEYISIDLNKLDGLASKGDIDAFAKGFATGKDLSNKIYAFVDGLVQKTFKDYQQGEIKKVGNDKYSLEITGADVINNAVDLASFIVKNYDSFADSLSGFFTSLTDDEFKGLDMGLNKEEVIKGIEDSKKEIAQNKEMYVSQIELAKSMINSDSYKAMMDAYKGVTVKYELAKVNKSEYTENLKLGMNIAPFVNFSMSMYGGNENPITKDYKIAINTSSNVKKLSEVTIEAPTKGVVDINSVAKYVRQKLTVNIDNGYYSRDIAKVPTNAMYGDNLDVKVINDYSYLPARRVVELLGDEINWDANAKKAYVTVNGQNVYLDGVILNDRTYIKVRELEKVGYKINWNEETREASIEK